MNIILTISILSILIYGVWAVNRNQRAVRAQIIEGCSARLAVSEVGFSVVVSGVTQIEYIEELLSLEYFKYEVVIAIDSHTTPELLRRVKKRYAMMRVNYTPTTELQVDADCALYRSRQRRYRRLVIIDHRHTNHGDEWNTATGVASHEYIVPLKQPQMIDLKALKRLAWRIDNSAQAIPRLFERNLLSPLPCVVVMREELIECGGFGFSNHPLLATVRRM